jgi:predicted tellurium resistance membrane protein TerC
MLALLTDPHAWAALAALTALEIVLGIDNVVFISILVARLPADRARQARRLGLALALVFRLALLFGLTALIKLTRPVVTVLGNDFSWHDIILIAGGLFLIAKATREIHDEIEGPERPADAAPGAGAAFLSVSLQVVVIDLVFSLDSIITAIGMARDIEIMVAAVVLAVIVMYAASGAVSDFIAGHPTTKMLALAFLLMIGAALVADGFDIHIPRGYIYFAMAFAAAVETFNVVAGRKRGRRDERNP